MVMSAPTPLEGRTYLATLRDHRYARWRPAVGMMLFTLLAVAASIALLLGPILVLGQDAAGYVDTFNRPSGLLLLNLSLAALIPAALFSAWAVHHVRPGRVVSVIGRFRWSFLGLFLLLAVIAVVLGVIAAGLVVSEPIAGEEELDPFVGWAAYAPIVLVVLLSTPLQAAGEEFAFRGYLMQAIGAWAQRWTWVPVVVTSLLFALAHGSQDLALFVDRFLFGLVAAIVTIRTGGLEAAIAYHVANNVIALMVVGAFGGLSETLTASEAPWSLVAVDVVQLTIFVIGVELIASGRMRRRSAPDPHPIAPTEGGPGAYGGAEPAVDGTLDSSGRDQRHPWGMG